LLPLEYRRVMRELRENGWSWEGIAAIWHITPAAARWLARDDAEEKTR